MTAEKRAMDSSQNLMAILTTVVPSYYADAPMSATGQPNEDPVSQMIPGIPVSCAASTTASVMWPSRLLEPSLG